jgi:two-component system response regulator YesN
MLNLIIVEDEDTAREGLRSLIDWESLGISITGMAANGIEALQLFDSNPVDLVLSDIRMPLMDGLQLVAEIRKRDKPVTCVLLSGYSDFEYAQQAIRAGVTDYILKPCAPEEIRTIFKKITATLTKEHKDSHEGRGMAQHMHVNLQQAKKQFLSQWLNRPALFTENRPEQMKSINMTISSQHVIVMAFRLNNRTLEALNYNEIGTQLLSFAAANIIQETLERKLMQPIEVIFENEMIIAVGNGLFEWMEDKLKQGLALVQEHLTNYLKVTASVGVGNSQPDIHTLHVSYREALEALELRFFQGTGDYFYRDVAGQKKEALPTSINSVELLKLEQSALENIRAGLYAEVLNDTENWLAVFQSAYTQSRKQINSRAFSFLSRLMHIAQERGIQGTGGFSEFDLIEEQMQHTETLEELSGFVYRSIRRIVEALNPQKTPKRKVQQALEYIEANYHSSELSLAGVAKLLFVSSTYLSTLFKQELGVNFLDYVHQFRIERAKALLQSTDYKIQTVAREVGYFDEAHFTRTFKKWAGTLPSQYKKDSSVRGDPEQQ